MQSGWCPTQFKVSSQTIGSLWLTSVAGFLHWNAHFEPQIVPAVQDIFKLRLFNRGNSLQRLTITLYFNRQLRTIKPVSKFRTLAMNLCLPSGNTNLNSGPNNVSISYKSCENGKFVLHAKGAGGSNRIPSRPSRAMATISSGHFTHTRCSFLWRFSNCLSEFWASLSSLYFIDMKFEREKRFCWRKVNVFYSIFRERERERNNTWSFCNSFMYVPLGAL